jgi:hypothetical protein
MAGDTWPELKVCHDSPGRWQLLGLRLLDLIVPATVAGLNNVNVVMIQQA